jgi:hypothetical protein
VSIGRPQFCRRVVTRGQMGLTPGPWEIQRFRPFRSGVESDFRVRGGVRKVMMGEANDNAGVEMS